MLNLLSKSSDETWVPTHWKAEYDPVTQEVSIIAEYKPTRHVAMLFGFETGIGYEYEFTSGFTLSINPYTRWNGIGNVGSPFFLTQIKDHVYLQVGVKLGVGYKF